VGPDRPSTGVGPDTSVAVDVLGLALRFFGGHLSRIPVLAHGVRGGLLIDLALAGRISSTDTGTEMDTTPTGWALADELLHDIDRHPTRSMSDLLQRGHPHLSTAIDDLRSSGQWRLEHRGLTTASATYSEVNTQRSVLLAGRLESLAHGHTAHGDERDAAALALALACGLVSDRRSTVYLGRVVAGAGAVRWLVEEISEFIMASAAQDRVGSPNAQFYR
jgi:hypothetical protein